MGDGSSQTGRRRQVADLCPVTAKSAAVAAGAAGEVVPHAALRRCPLPGPSSPCSPPPSTTLSVTGPSSLAPSSTSRTSPATTSSDADITMFHKVNMDPRQPL